MASALAGGIGADNRYSFRLVRDLIRDFVLVTEDEIASAIRFVYSDLSLVVEGGGAVGLAALLHARYPAPDRAERTGGVDLDGRRNRARRVGRGVPGRDGPIVVVVSGGNIARQALAEVTTGSSVEDRADPT